MVYLARVLISVLVVVPWYVIAAFVGVMKNAAGLKIGIAANRFLLSLFEVEVTTEGDDSAQQQLAGSIFVLLNQSSLLDGTLGSVVIPLPFRVIVNIEYAIIPFVGWGAAVFGWVVVRQWPKQAKRVLSKIGAYVKNGGNVYVSIEGKRSRNGSLSQYKKGPVVLAIQLGAPIVPMYFDGARSCFPYGSLRVRPGRVNVKFLPAISTEGLGYDDRDRLVAELRSLAKREMSA